MFAELIQEGYRPVRGYFNIYTSPVHSYIIAICFSLLGESIGSLRISGIFFNLLAACAYVDMVRRLFPSLAIWSFYFLITMPFYIVMSRIAGENYALNPFFLFVGMWSFYVIGSSEQKWFSKAGYTISGLFFYMGVWNHVVFLPTVVSIIIGYCVVSRVNIKKALTVFPWFIFGGLIGVIPKLYGVIVHGYSFIPQKSIKGIPALSNTLINLIYTLGGDGLYAKICGEILFSFNWFLPLSVVVSAIIQLRSKTTPSRKKMWKITVLCFFFSSLGTWLITPLGLSGPRLWLLPLWFIPFLLALSLPVSVKWLKISIGVIIISINLLSTGLNYFYNFLQDGGIPKDNIYIGGFYDSGLNFIDMRPLVKKLNKYKSNKPIYIEDVNTHRMLFLINKSYRSRVKVIKDIKKGERLPINSLVIRYKFKDGRKVWAVININKSVAALDSALSTSNYAVYKVVK